MINTIKAKWRKSTVLDKLTYLKGEWIEGRATKTDVPYWEKSLEELRHTIVSKIPELQESLEMYDTIYGMLQYELEVKDLAKQSTPALIMAGVKGDIAKLKLEMTNQKQPADRVFVLGDFIPADENRVEALKEVIRLAIEEKVVFMIGKREREELLNEDWGEVEQCFIKRLPMNVDTEDFGFFADAEGDGLYNLDEILEGELPNLSQKMFVYRSTMDYADGFKMNQEQRVMALNHGLLLRLDVRESAEEMA